MLNNVRKQQYSPEQRVENYRGGSVLSLKWSGGRTLLLLTVHLHVRVLRNRPHPYELNQTMSYNTHGGTDLPG